MLLPQFSNQRGSFQGNYKAQDQLIEASALNLTGHLTHLKHSTTLTLKTLNLQAERLAQNRL